MITDPGILAALAGVGLAAGAIDAVAGGGGLLTMPALLATGLPPHLALGTNKGQSVFGSTAALLTFRRSPLFDRRRAGLGFAAGLVGAIGGALLLQLVPSSALRPLVMGLLLAAVVLVLIGPRLAPAGGPRQRGPGTTGAVAGGIGAYDGFFGPGTGTFLILANVRLWGDSPSAASANAKAVNCASNWGALLVFACLGQALWLVALVMGLGQLLGGWLGARLVLRSGPGLVRWTAAAICLALVAKLAWDQFIPGTTA